jgi:hypothetical protein
MAKSLFSREPLFNCRTCRRTSPSRSSLKQKTSSNQSLLVILDSISVRSASIQILDSDLSVGGTVEFGVGSHKCRKGSKTNKSNCRFWEKLIFDV